MTSKEIVLLRRLEKSRLLVSLGDDADLRQAAKYLAVRGYAQVTIDGASAMITDRGLLALSEYDLKQQRHRERSAQRKRREARDHLCTWVVSLLSAIIGSVVGGMISHLLGLLDH